MGPSATGKTQACILCVGPHPPLSPQQLCHMLAAATALTEQHVVYIDTAKSFSAERLCAILSAAVGGDNLTIQRALNAVRCREALSALQVRSCLLPSGHTQLMARFHQVLDVIEQIREDLVQQVWRLELDSIILSCSGVVPSRSNLTRRI